MNPTFDAVKFVIMTTLGVEDRFVSLDASTQLLGNLPELDSLAVVELVLALEERFAIKIEDHEITADMFETLGNLSAMIDHKLGAHRPTGHGPVAPSDAGW